MNDAVSGCTELRVHGVSGTAPEGVLGHPHVSRVAGDATAGFYRRCWESASASADTDQGRIEAYSWAGLTSGSWKRALWLLLLPFMLVNMAFYMTPLSPLDSRRRWVWVRKVSESAQRLLALSLTVTIVIAVVTIAVDLLGWQCGRAGASCAGVGGADFWTWSWVATPGRRLAITAVLPIGAVLLLWWLANSTWAVAEARSMPACAPAQEQGWQTPLEDRSMWNGQAPVARLRALHVATAFAVIGMFLTVPFLTGMDQGPGRLLAAGAWSGRGWVAAALLASFLAIAAVCVLATMVDGSLSDRERPGDERTRRFRRVLEESVKWGSVGLVGAAIVVAWSADPRGFGPVAERGPGNLPWLSGLLVVMCLGQAGLIATTAVLTGAQSFSCWRLGQRHRAGKPVQCPVVEGHAWFGMALPMVAAAAWLAGGGLGTALTVRAADLLGSPQATNSGQELRPDSVLLPAQYFWVTLAATVTVLLAIVLALGTWLWLRIRRQAIFDQHVKTEYGDIDWPAVAKGDDNWKRGRTIAASWAWASVSEVVRLALGWFAIATAVVIAAGMIGYATAPTMPVVSLPGWTVTTGSLIMASAVLGLVYVGRRAYSNAAFRRTVGILWDIGTFWPRATHPLAPPCYAERTMPDLAFRIDSIYRAGGTAVLSCHSQGSIIGAAVVAQLRVECYPAIAFLTYGSPLGRIYARFFPAYFGMVALRRIGTLLAETPAAGVDGRAAGEDLTPAAPPAGWPWRNLYRPSDPIGGPIFGRPAGATAEDSDPAGLVDRRLLDPAFAKPSGDTCYPATRGHSDYFADPLYDASVAALQRCCRAPAAAGEQAGNGRVPIAEPAPTL